MSKVKNEDAESGNESGEDSSNDKSSSSLSSEKTGMSLERLLWRLLSKATFLDTSSQEGGSEDGDVKEAFVFESSLTLVVYLVCVVSIIRGAVLTAYSANKVAQGLSFGVAGAYVGGLLLYRWTRDFEVYRNTVLTAMSVFGVLEHVWAGGWAQSGMVLLWGFLAMLLAILYNRRSAYIVWWTIYTVIMVILALREATAPHNLSLPRSARTLIFFLNIYTPTVCIIFILSYYKSTVLRQRRDIVRAKRAAEQLLNNMLPPKIIRQIKSGQDHVIEEFDSVTVFFLDICQFTNLSSTVRPEQMFQFINELWLVVDDVAEKNGVYKIETIGDAYVAVAGCPEKCEDHADRMADFALQVMEKSKTILCPDGKPLRFRMGFHSGPVVAGIVGYKMPHYSLFGETVNTASKMESNGQPGMIHVSPTSAALLEGSFELEPRGPIEIKGKGTMETFFLKSRRVDTSQKDDQNLSSLSIPNVVETEESQDPSGLVFVDPKELSFKGNEFVPGGVHLPIDQTSTKDEDEPTITDKPITSLADMQLRIHSSDEFLNETAGVDNDVNTNTAGPKIITITKKDSDSSIQKEGVLVLDIEDQ